MILSYDPLKRSIDLALPKVALALALPLTANGSDVVISAFPAGFAANMHALSK